MTLFRTSFSLSSLISIYSFFFHSFLKIILFLCNISCFFFSFFHLSFYLYLSRLSMCILPVYFLCLFSYTVTLMFVLWICHSFYLSFSRVFIFSIFLFIYLLSVFDIFPFFHVLFLSSSFPVFFILQQDPSGGKVKTVIPKKTDFKSTSACPQIRLLKLIGW